MAASDQTYRDQKVLDWVFAVSCVLMLVVTVWMFVQDFNREYKHVRRDFRDVEEAMAQRAVLDLAPDAEALGKIVTAEQAVADARAKLDEVKKEHYRNVNAQLPLKLTSEATYSAIKADFDSLVSLYDIAVEQMNAAADKETQARLKVAVDEQFTEVESLRARLLEAKDKADAEAAKLTDIEKPTKAAADALSKAEDALKLLVADFDRFGRLVEQKRWGAGDSFRRLPILDAFKTPVPIEQYPLDDLPINYNFKYVTRYDRCTTCHLGFDRASYTKDALAALAETDSPQLQDKLRNARAAIEKRQEISKKAGVLSTGDLTLAPVKLTPAQVTQYAAHPRLDLFVDGNSPHAAEKFGCSIYHGGQGSSTDFYNASHTPNNSLQTALWQDQAGKGPPSALGGGGGGWKSNHYWDYPMLPSRFIESSCVKCHHHMTDLIADGSRVEAPKLMHGYQLVKDNGCFGCHEIAGIKGGRSVGPDLRLEPSPPLDAYTPAERAKMTADTQNPPGTMRKVGPSLRRLGEKTNAEWLARWIRAPRDFRPDTKMPHFYGLSNNHPDVLPKDQKQFPDSEIHAIVHYLLTESGNYLQGKDRGRQAVLAKQKELQGMVTNKTISDPQRRELDEIDRRLQLNRVPAPLVKKVKAPDGKEIEELVLDHDGKDTVALPALPADDKARQEHFYRGRLLFSEKGCLACHIHEGTQAPLKLAGLPDLPEVHGAAQFAPNLTRLAAKLGTQPNDLESGRRWLVRWILNPSAHFPRTRMPVTHLTADEANDIALWLLGQRVEDKSWVKETPKEPGNKELKELARVFLSRSYTRSEVEKYLEGGVSHEDLNRMQKPLDADERELESGGDRISQDNKFKMYIGKKAIGQLGCYACHDIPGFDNAKPIGTPLNDWGKKDPERLAFEDVTAFVHKNYTIVDQFKSADGKGKDLYEKYFADALDHHQREGFLHQKLTEPRSYDFERLRVWDERLRMPQFRFARSEKRTGETDEQYHARQQVEEAEAREAVMTFILGLIAEPIPPKFVNNPAPDRLAEVKGRQVLDKYNCAGCHLVRPGVYEFPISPESKQTLAENYDTAQRTFAPDFMNTKNPLFDEHNAWMGLAQPRADRVKVFGLGRQLPPREEGGPPLQVAYLIDSLRLPLKADDGLQMNLPAASTIILPKQQTIPGAEAYGGTFADLLTGYLMKKDRVKYSADDKARPAVPPSLIREGEKTQPLWLYGFLKEPTALRPMTTLRMPKFNMSDDEALALVNYFSAVDKVSNPGIGLHSPYFAAPEREESYLRQKTDDYVKHLKQTKATGKQTTLFDQKLAEMAPIWEDQLKGSLADAQARLKAAESILEKAKEEENKEPDAAKKKEKAEAVKKAQEARDAAQKAVEAAQAALDKKDVAAMRRTWEQQEVYLSDGFKLLVSEAVCLNCHQVGPYPPKEKQGTPLDISHQRLRGDWTQRWLAGPQRFMHYPTPMPQNFARNAAQFQDIFPGPSFQQLTAARDALMNYPRVIDLPANRARPVTLVGGGK